MSRIGDALRTLLGRRDYQIRHAAQLARIEAEWASICAEIQNLLENLNRLDARLRKRAERARKADRPEEPTHLPVASGAVSIPDSKAGARARFAQRGLALPPRTQVHFPMSEDGNDESGE